MATIKLKNSTKVMSCTCDMGDGAQYQDKIYGKNKRVHNSCKDGFRCTVCGKEKKNAQE